MRLARRSFAKAKASRQASASSVIALEIPTRVIEEDSRKTPRSFQQTIAVAPVFPCIETSLSMLNLRILSIQRLDPRLTVGTLLHLTSTDRFCRCNDFKLRDEVFNKNVGRWRRLKHMLIDCFVASMPYGPKGNYYVREICMQYYITHSKNL